MTCPLLNHRVVFPFHLTTCDFESVPVGAELRQHRRVARKQHLDDGRPPIPTHRMNLREGAGTQWTLVNVGQPRRKGIVVPVSTREPWGCGPSNGIARCDMHRLGHPGVATGIAPF